MNPLLRIVAVTALLVGQLTLSTQAWSLGDCHQEAGNHAHEMSMHLQHGDPGSPSTDGSVAAGDCHCVGGFHCGLAALATDTFPAGADAGEHPAYATAPCQRPGLAHRREVDRPPA